MFLWFAEEHEEDTFVPSIAKVPKSYIPNIAVSPSNDMPKVVSMPKISVLKGFYFITF